MTASESTQPTPSFSVVHAAALVVTAGCIFALDLALALGVANGILYIALVLIGFHSRDRRLILTAALLGTALTLLGMLLSPPGGEHWKVLINRHLAIVVLWLTASICLRQNRQEKTLQSSRDDLEKRVGARTSQLNRANDLLQRESAFLQLNKDIAIASNQKQGIEETMRYCLEQVCAHAGWPVGHIYLPAGKNRDRLVTSSIWYLENPDRFQTFQKITEDTPLNIGEGLPGRVLLSGQPAWIIDVTQDPNFPRAKLAKDIGVKAGFAFPILTGKSIAGVMEFFSTQAVEPDRDMLETMANIGTLFGRVIERNQAEKEAKQSHDDLRNLYQRLQVIREEERTRVAREVHDELAQGLTTLKLELALLGNKSDSDPTGLKAHTDRMQETIDRTLKSVHQLVMDLRPPILDDLGLGEAIDWQGKDFEKKTGLRFHFEWSRIDEPLDSERATTVFRIFQETLTNVARHAEAKNIYATLKFEGSTLTLKVRDDGKGIAPEKTTAPKSLGLLGIRERTLIWGGQMRIERVPEGGTCITIQIPIE